MSTDRETARAVRSWLEEGVTRVPDRVLDAVLDQVPATPQRRPIWRARRFPQMTNPVRYAIAAAAVLVVALIGYQFLPSSNVGSGPSPGPTAPVVSLAPTLRPPAFPSAGPVVGRNQFTLENVTFTVDFATPGWSTGGDLFVGNGAEDDPAGRVFLFWPEDPDFVYVDSCGQKAAKPVGPTAADMAQAIAGMSQVEVVSGPTSLTLDGNPAQHVVVRVPDDIPCAPNDFYLWGNTSVSRYATTAGSTYSVWIIDAGDTRIQIDGEWYAGADPNVGAELEAIVESIQFE